MSDRAHNYFIKSEGLGIVEAIGRDMLILETKRKRQIGFREFVRLLKQLKLLPQDAIVGSIGAGLNTLGESGFVIAVSGYTTSVKAQGPDKLAERRESDVGYNCYGPLTGRRLTDMKRV